MDKNNFIKLSIEYTAGDSTAIKNHYSITELELFGNYFLITTVLEILAQGSLWFFLTFLPWTQTETIF